MFLVISGQVTGIFSLYSLLTVRCPLNFLIPNYVKVHSKKNFNFARDFIRDNFCAVRLDSRNAGKSFPRRTNERGNDCAKKIGTRTRQADFNSVR